MASNIPDPRHFAQHINEKMLEEFLKKQNPPITFTLVGDNPTKRKRVSEDAVNRFVEAIENLNDKEKAEYLFMEMVYINALSSERHTTNLENEALEKGIVYDITDYAKCECYDERALWWYMHHKDIFDSYFERADTENLAGLREVVIKDEHIVTKEQIADEKKLLAFGEGVAKIYENTLRGKKFKVSHFLEKECALVRVYLQNLPNNQLVFVDEKGAQPRVGRTPTVRSLFSIVLVYSPTEKTLGIRSDNPKENVPKLGDLFCQTFLNCTYADTTERKYNVENRGSIEKLELTPDPMSDIERCYLKAVEYARRGEATKTLRLDIGGKQSHEGTGVMEAYIKQAGIKENEWIPKKFEIKFIFRKVDETKGRKRQMTTTITKRGDNTKNTKEDQKIKQFLIEKGFVS